MQHLCPLNGASYWAKHINYCANCTTTIEALTTEWCSKPFPSLARQICETNTKTTNIPVIMVMMILIKTTVFCYI